MIKLSIVIIAYNEEKYLPILLQSLKAQSVSDDLFEILIIDSNSDDNTEINARKFEDEFSNFKYVKLDKTNGPAYGRNNGARYANGNKLLFLDADTKLPPNFIEQILTEIDIYKADVATCSIRIAEKNILSNFGANFLNFFMILLKPIYSSGYGACFYTTKKVFEKVGGFDETLGVCEDCNFIKIARRKYKFKYSILTPYFYTSDRRAKKEGSFRFFLKYMKIHLFRMLTGKEILKDNIIYKYGDFN